MKYFISYNILYKNENFGFGSMGITITRPITDYNIIDEINTTLKKNNPDFKDIIILYWRRFEEVEK